MTAHGADGTLAEYGGAWIVRKEDAVRVSVPSELLDDAQTTLDRASHEDFSIEQALTSLYQPDPMILGPSLHGYASAETLTDVPFADEVGVSEVSPDELSTLKLSCPESEWNEGGFATAPARLFALTLRNEIVAAANLTEWRADFDDVGLVVHPAHRSNGYGAMISSYAARVAAHEYDYARYRVLKTNFASVALQRKLGFEVYCEQTAVRRAKQRLLNLSVRPTTEAGRTENVATVSNGFGRAGTVLFP